MYAEYFDELLVIRYEPTGDGNGIPNWIEQDQIWDDREGDACYALVIPKRETETWAREEGYDVRNVTPEACPETFGGVTILWNNLVNAFALLSNEPLMEKSKELPSWHYRTPQLSASSWAYGYYAPRSIAVRYKIEKSEQEQKCPTKEDAAQFMRDLLADFKAKYPLAHGTVWGL